VYRQVTVNFTPSASSAVVRFGDGGLQGVADESWGIDNVVVRRGEAIVFADDFESGTANAAWSEGSVNSEGIAAFTRFSGRFSNNASQALSLSGLSAGQSYSLRFDLLVLDSWDGNNTSYGPDLIDVSVDGVSVLRETLSNVADANSAQTLRASAGIGLQVVPTLTGIDSGRPGEDGQFYLRGSGFMEGASSITIGGVALVDSATNLTPFDVTGTRNDSLTVVAPRTLDGPIRITTEGGWAQIPGARFGAQPVSVFTGISAGAASGIPAEAGKPSAVTGQTIVLQGQGFTNGTLVQFQGLDDSGTLGTLTRTGSVSGGGTALSVVVPALARSGSVSVLGSGASFGLQVVPTLRAVGGAVAAGNTLVLEGTGLTANDLAIAIDGRAVGSFSVRTVIDGASTTADQQLLTLSVPSGVGAGTITVSTAGGSSTLRSGILAITALSDLAPAGDVGDTLASALNPALGPNQSVKISASVANALDVDLHRLDLAAGDQLTLNMANAASLYAYARIFDAAGTQLLIPPYFSPGSANAPQRWTAPSGGTFYLGISGYSNTSYNPSVAGSGNNANYTGSYTLSLERLAAGTSHLWAISASAASGSAAQTGVASANTGQTITVSGTGLLANDRLVFTTLDNGGNLGETTVTPSNLDLGAQTLTAVVPAGATTARVRLERDSVGLLLQIVPTISDVAISGAGFIGNTLQLSGSGFAEGASAVLLGGLRIDDISRSAGLSASNTAISLTVPSGAATGPIRVATVGGTSAAFGIGFTGISAASASGTPAHGAQAAVNPGQTLTLQGTALDATTDVVFQVIDASGNVGEQIVRPSTVNAAGTQALVRVPNEAVSGMVRVVGSANALALQVLPVISDVQVESVAADGSTATLLIAGTGFVEGGGSEYRFGTRTVLDAGATTGPDVLARNDAVLGYVANGYVRVTVPLSAGVFGAISIKTGGGVSGSYSVGLSSITSVALSGTPADGAQASANAGQAVTLNGAGLSTATDVLLRYVDTNGALQLVQLSPSGAALDGSSATLLVPAYANGAFTLQVFGSAAQPLLQIVPTVQGVDVQDRTVLLGSGFVEGASSYSFAGATVVDTGVDASTNVDVQNGRVYLNRNALARHGLGEVSVSTAGGTSAPVALNTVRLSVEGTYLGDVAIDPTSGAIWVSDYTNPGHLLRINAQDGTVAQTITLGGDYGTSYLYNYAGLQVVGAAMTLGSTSVPAGSLLVFNGYANPDRVIAVNPGTGAIIASLALAGNYDLTGAVFNPGNGHIYLTEHNGAGNRIVELSATSGAQLGVMTAPFNVQSWAGLAIDPSSGHLWLGAVNGGPQLVEYRIEASGVLTELRRVDTRAQGLNDNEISGLSFAPDGSLWAASTQGELYRLTV